MDVIMLSRNLYEAYAAILLGAGAVLGITLGLTLGRLWKRRVSAPSPTTPEQLQQRISLLEQEFEHTNAEVRRLLEDREFMRELRRPKSLIAAA